MAKGKTLTVDVGEGEFVTVTPGKMVVLHGTRKRYMREIKEMVDHPYERVFEIGDTAEYDSYNLSYTGKIVGIGPKTVTIEKDHRGGRKRLKLATFHWRNWNFDAEETARANSEMMITL